MLAVDPVLADDPFLWALLDDVDDVEGVRPLTNNDFHPMGDFLCLRLLPRLRWSPPGRSMMVWYLGGNDAGPPPTSM